MTSSMPHRYCDSAHRRNSPTCDARRRGIAFVVSLSVIVVVASVLMVLVRYVQTEVRASVNHGSQTQARWIADGVVRALLVELARDPRLAEPNRDFAAVEAQAGILGDGLYWVLHPDPTDADRYEFGITSEAGKVNLNTADAEMLEALHPDVTPQLAEAILAWRGDADDTAAGASSYYLARPRPYRAKEGPFESVGEMLLVRDVDRDLLYGPRRARHDHVELNVDASTGAAPAQRFGDRHPRGLAPLVTVFSAEPNRSLQTGEPRLNVNRDPMSEIAEALSDWLDDEARAEALAGAIGSERPYDHALDFLVRTGVDADEAALLYDRITTSSDTTLRGLVDVATASVLVLEALPGLDTADAERIVAGRAGVAEPTASPLWFVEAIGSEQANEIGSLITTRSMQFGTDVLAVSGDGRSFVRRRVVLDVAPVLEGEAPRVVHSEDVTRLGWPLSPAILEALRAGESVDGLARRYRDTEGAL